jgi:hypothetical protein
MLRLTILKACEVNAKTTDCGIGFVSPDARRLTGVVVFHSTAGLPRTQPLL